MSVLGKVAEALVKAHQRASPSFGNLTIVALGHALIVRMASTEHTLECEITALSAFHMDDDGGAIRIACKSNGIPQITFDYYGMDSTMLTAVNVCFKHLAGPQIAFAGMTWSNQG